MSAAPVFQEADRCDVCKCSFTAFRRRHHCRCCGRTLCHEHSSNYMALPQFGIYSDVRVCSDCFNNSSRTRNNDPASSEAIDVAPVVGGPHFVDEDINAKVESSSGQTSTVLDCMCGMPLCICEAPKADPTPLKVQSSIITTAQPNQKPKKAATSTQRTAESFSNNFFPSTSKPSPFSKLSHAPIGSRDEACMNYDENGEGLREAIKNNDTVAVKMLLSKGVDANFCDKQGLTLLHLAAVFNQTEIAFILMDHGANPLCKNAQGETPLDCAPAMLQHKMRKKMEECG